MGVYQYMEITIDKTINVSGSVVENGVTYKGRGVVTADKEVHYFEVKEGSLANAVEIKSGGKVTLLFDISWTVTYQSGTSPDAVLDAKKPVITFLVQ